MAITRKPKHHEPPKGVRIRCHTIVSLAQRIRDSWCTESAYRVQSQLELLERDLRTLRNWNKQKLEASQ